jgi:hypothetical protein
MFGYEDRRTEKERLRDLEAADKRQAENLLALGFLKTVVRPRLKEAGVDVGLAGSGVYNGAELLAEVDGVTYRITASVDHDE